MPIMFEAIVTFVFPATTNEPAHTVIRRIEFESRAHMQAWYETGIGPYALHDELLVAQ